MIISLYQFLFLSSKGGQKRWLLTFSLHCLCSSTSGHTYSFRGSPSLLIDFKNSKRLTYFCILLCICYRFSHLIGLLSVTWLSPFYKFTRFLIYFLFLSDEGPMLETLGHIYYPYWQYTDLFVLSYTYIVRVSFISELIIWRYHGWNVTLSILNSECFKILYKKG